MRKTKRTQTNKERDESDSSHGSRHKVQRPCDSTVGVPKFNLCGKETLSLTVKMIF